MQADEYDSDVYDIDPAEREYSLCRGTLQFLLDSSGRIIRVVIYTDKHTEPVQQELRLRCISNFEFKSFELARVVNAISDDGASCTKFLRYSLSTKKFTADRVLTTLNLSGRGNIVLYRAESLAEQQCPGIKDWMRRAEASAIPGI
jgi:hypothetical protein